MAWPLMFSIAGAVVGDRGRADSQRDRQRHRRQHVGGVVFLVQCLVADHRPAGGLDHLDVEPVLCIKAHRLGHDDRRRAGDRDEADLQRLFSSAGGVGKGFGAAPSGNTSAIAAAAAEAPTRRRKPAPRRRFREQPVQHALGERHSRGRSSFGDCDRSDRIGVVLRGARMTAAAASYRRVRASRKRVVETAQSRSS